MRDVKRFIREVATQYGCNVKFDNSQKYMGQWDKDKRLIVISGFYGKDTIINTFFHELAHQYNHDMDKYPAYHKHESVTKAYRLTAWKAECYTEKIGKRLMKCYLPDLKYKSWYVSKCKVKWKKEWFKKHLDE